MAIFLRCHPGLSIFPIQTGSCFHQWCQKQPAIDVERNERITGEDTTTSYAISIPPIIDDYYEIKLTHTQKQESKTGPENVNFWIEWDRQLPETGFSASQVTELREGPQEVVYGTTGLTLQIPELDVTEAIKKVPEVDGGSLPNRWEDRSYSLS